MRNVPKWAKAVGQQVDGIQFIGVKATAAFVAWRPLLLFLLVVVMLLRGYPQALIVAIWRAGPAP